MITQYQITHYSWNSRKNAMELLETRIIRQFLLTHHSWNPQKHAKKFSVSQNNSKYPKIVIPQEF